MRPDGLSAENSGQSAMIEADKRNDSNQKILERKIIR